jgi:hypothetical protein
LAFLRFCVPSQSYTHWEINLSVEGDILNAFSAVTTAKPQRDIATPKVRKDKSREDEKEDKGPA